MKKFCFVVLLCTIPWAAHAQFSIGNLVAIRVGNGSVVSPTGAENFSIDQFTTAGSLTSSTTISGMTQRRNNGNSLNIAFFGGFAGDVANYGVSYAGYTDPAGPIDPSFSGHCSVGNLRFNSPSGTQSSAALPIFDNSVRSISSVWSNGTNYFAAGLGQIGFTNVGLVKSDLVGNAATISSTIVPTNVQISGNDAYLSSSDAHGVGLYKVANATTGSSLTANLILSMTGLQPIDFEVARNGSGTPTSVLVADRTSAALGGLYFATGWNPSANGGTGAFTGAATQILSGTAIQAALGGPAVNGLSQIVVSGTDVYAVTFEPVNAGQFGNNRIIKASFANGFASANTGISLVATAGTSREFQGIEMVPEPASFLVIGIGIAGLAVRRRNRR